MAPPSDDSHPATILVVDDERLVRDLTCTMLRRMGYEVLSAADGAEGLAVFRARAREIDAIVLDQTMPRMPGHEVVAAVRAEGYATPILVVTGYSAESVLEEMGRTSHVRVLHKPFRRQALADAVTALLASAAEQD